MKSTAQTLPENRPSGGINLPSQCLLEGVDVDIVLGMPKHQCRYHGICAITRHRAAVPISHQTNCPTVRGCLIQPHPDFCLLGFDRKSISAKADAYHFKRKTFTINEDVCISQVFKPPQSGSLHLTAGRYQIEKNADYYLLLIGLKR